MKKRRKHGKSAPSLTPSRILWVFSIFCLFGFLLEGLYWVHEYGYFAHRKGFIYGPLSGVYGLGAVFLLLALYRFKNKNFFFLFGAAFVLAVATEFSLSLMEEWVFGYTSWDYGDAWFSFFGRANLLFAAPWALFGVLLIKWGYPLICRFLDAWPRKFYKVMTIALLVFMFFNGTVTAAALYRYDQRQHDIPATHVIQKTLDKYYPDKFLEDRFARLVKGRV